MSDDDRLNEALAADVVPPPPEGLARRVAERSHGPRTDPDRATVRPRARLLPIVGAVAAGLALAATGGWLLRSGSGAVTAGELAPAARDTVRLGKRAVLVAEAGAELRWRPGAGGGVTVEQPAGDVFYRVDAGGQPFVVETPFGQVHVRGTCFRVEVTNMKLINRQTISAGALGAALGGVVMVTVYEGNVLLARGNDQVALAPGERGEAAGDGRLRLMAAGDSAAGGGTSLARTAGGLPRFDDAQALRARIAEQDRELAELRAFAPAAKMKREKEGGRTLDPSKEELLARASRCEVRFDVPPLGTELAPKWRQRMDLSEAELVAVNETIKETTAQVDSELRRLYVEMSGDAATAAKLSTGTLRDEIFAKAPKGASQAARQQLSRERAGLVTPPADLAATPVTERTLRLMMSLGDDFERRLAQRMGPERAHALRARDDGWGSRMSLGGCE